MIKRTLEILITLCALVIFSPLIIIVSLIIVIYLGRPVIFSQLRPGINGVPFKMYKFRSMRDIKDENGVILSDKKRLTPLGIKIRALSLDELPSFWNVLKGDMSLVGPRPLLMEYLALYNKKQALRNEVKPGITGWAQINGRNAISWEEKLDYDVWYVKHQSLLLDMKILFLTILKVIKRDGISQEGQVTMEKFRGTPK